jgi:predicted dehydrogenase
MTGSRFRVGIIGAGRISDLHAIEYLQNPLARIVGVCDRDVAQARSKLAAWGIPDVAVEEDVDRFLAREDIDLVEILLPHHLHLPVALKSMAAGKIVSLQKPMCVDLAEADQLVAAAEAYDRPFKVFENFIFYPPVLKARELIDQGAIADRSGRDWHAAVDPHQVEPGAQRDGVGSAAIRIGVAQ